MKEIREDVTLRFIGAHRDAIEEVVTCLHLPPCLNKRVDLSAMTTADIVDTFWNEFKAFQSCSEPFHHTSRWATKDVSSGRSVQANIEYLYIRSYGQTASVTSNLWVYSRT